MRQQRTNDGASELKRPRSFPGRQSLASVENPITPPLLQRKPDTPQHPVPPVQRRTDGSNRKVGQALRGVQTPRNFRPRKDPVQRRADPTLISIEAMMRISTASTEVIFMLGGDERDIVMRLRLEQFVSYGCLVLAGSLWGSGQGNTGESFIVVRRVDRGVMSDIPAVILPHVCAEVINAGPPVY